MEGAGNAYDFGARIYDPRSGRFYSVDPLTREYSSMTPYCFAANNSVKLIDVNGEGPGDPIETQALFFVNKTLTTIISGASLAVTSIGAPITRVIYEGVTGKLGYNIAPVIMTENWEFKTRNDLMQESLTPKQGKEIITSHVNTALMFIPVKSPVSGSPIVEKVGSSAVKAIVKKSVSKSMDVVIEHDKNSYEYKLKDNLRKIDQRKEILHDHLDQLQVMNKNKSDYSKEDFNNIYKALKHDYARLSKLRNDRKAIVENQKK